MQRCCCVELRAVAWSWVDPEFCAVRNDAQRVAIDKTATDAVAKEPK